MNNKTHPLCLRLSSVMPITPGDGMRMNTLELLFKLCPALCQANKSNAKQFHSINATLAKKFMNLCQNTLTKQQIFSFNIFFMIFLKTIYSSISRCSIGVSKKIVTENLTILKGMENTTINPLYVQMKYNMKYHSHIYICKVCDDF